MTVVTATRLSTSPSWDFVGLDTSWDADVLSPGAVAVLQDPQSDFVATVAAQSARKLVLFSHHSWCPCTTRPTSVRS